MNQLCALSVSAVKNLACLRWNLARKGAMSEPSAVLPSILDSIGDGVVLADERGNLLYNAAAQRMLCPEAGGAGASGTAEKPGLYLPDQVTPYPREQLPLARALRGEAVDDLPVFVRHPRQAEGRWTSVSARPLRDESGSLRGALAIFRDVTETRRAQEALRRERDWIAAVVDTIDNLVVVLDRQGRIVRFNRACERVTGYCFEEARGRTLWDLLLAPEETAQVQRVFEALRAGQFPNQHENHWLARDGSRRLIAWSNTALLDQEGAVEYVIGTGVDITEHKRLEEQLRQSQKMEAVGRLAGGVAHDFNNLLMVISGYGHMLLGRLEAGDPRRGEVEAILRAAESAAGLTNQLLAFSRRQIVQPKVLDLNGLVRNTDKMLHRVIGEDIELVTTLRPGAGKVRVDAGQIEQVLLNLVVNARDAMPGGGKLTLETAGVELDQEYARTHPDVQPGWYAMVAVSDSGKGMSDETRGHLFEPFFTTKEKGKGTGLGLSTVYGIVKQSGGDISFTTELGKGTIFRVYLPAVPEGGEVIRSTAGCVPETGARPVSGKAGAATILLAEDEAELSKLIRQILEQHGYTVLEAADSAEAIRLGEQQAGPIDLLLADVVMPRMSGSELARRLTASRPGLKVLYMSGYTDDVMVHHGVLEEGVTVLQKPFPPELLVATVRGVLEGPESR